jgi:1-acyl-sn-glycerol-3-phosphate acyltransferase
VTVLAGTPVLPEEKLWIWRVGFPPVRALARFLAPWRLEGAENIPQTGGYILVANHINWKDPPWIEFALGHAIRYMGKQELFETPVIGFLLRAIGAFPVRRGEADRGALRMALAVLAAGQPLGFFVEGHRSESGQLIRGRPGVGYVAQRSNAPIIPLAVSGTRGARLGAFWRRDIVIRVGKPFRAADLDVKSDDQQALVDAIMRRIAVLMPPEQRGVYRSGDSTADPNTNDDFVVVVPPTEFSSADRLFGEWLGLRGMSRSDLADDDVRIDIVRVRDGTAAKRYRVRRAVASRAAPDASDASSAEGDSDH